MEEEQASQVGKLGVVFWVSVVFSVIFLLWGAIFTENLSTVTSAILNFVLNNFGWLYLVATTLFLFFVIYLAFSRFGKIKLGKDDEEPEFGRLSWFAMLFAAGMGIGLVFWGVAEPMSHYGTPPYNLAKPSSPEAAELGLRYAFFHWGLHPWAVYAVIALCLAYFNFRREQGGLISSIFRPILGDRVDGPVGNIIDILAIVATLRPDGAVVGPEGSVHPRRTLREPGTAGIHGMGRHRCVFRSSRGYKYFLRNSTPTT